MNTKIKKSTFREHIQQRAILWGIGRDMWPLRHLIWLSDEDTWPGQLVWYCWTFTVQKSFQNQQCASPRSEQRECNLDVNVDRLVLTIILIECWSLQNFNSETHLFLFCHMFLHPFCFNRISSWTNMNHFQDDFYEQLKLNTRYHTHTKLRNKQKGAECFPLLNSAWSNVVISC